MQGKTVLASILQQEGTDIVFCFPNNPLIDAAASAGIRPIIARMERGAVNMADGYSRVHNGAKTGVCIVQAGPGIENAYPGVAQAYADSSPILMLPGHQGTEREGMPSDYRATPNYGGVTKWSDLINRSERIPEMMRRAYTQMRMGRPRPVLLEMPSDVLNGEIDETQFQYFARGEPTQQWRPQGCGKRSAKVVGRARAAFPKTTTCLWAQVETAAPKRWAYF